MSGADALWRDALEDGRFLLQRGVLSGRAFFPPREAEPGTGEAVEWIAACGAGTVYSVTVIGQKPPLDAYHVALIELAEGPRVMSRVEGLAADAVKIGMAVTARIVREDRRALLVFDPA